MPLQPTFAYLDWSLFAHAVLTIFEENQAHEDARGLKASADTWAWHSNRRQELFTRVSAKWCQACGKDASWFPYSEDAIARAYFRFRKRNAQELAEFRREIGLAMGRLSISINDE